MKKLFLSLCVVLLLAACGENKTETAGTETAPATDLTPAQKAELGASTYKTQCITCHGSDGKLGVSGAKDLSVSTLSTTDAINVVKYGRGGMMPYKDLFTNEQIENVVAYIETLRK